MVSLISDGCSTATDTQAICELFNEYFLSIVSNQHESDYQSFDIQSCADLNEIVLSFLTYPEKKYNWHCHGSIQRKQQFRMELM